MLDDATRHHLLKLLTEHPENTQRELAAAMGISLGKANYCIKALIEKGMIKTDNFRRNPNKGVYAYLLTQEGVQEKARVTVSASCTAKWPNTTPSRRRSPPCAGRWTASPPGGIRDDRRRAPRTLRRPLRRHPSFPLRAVGGLNPMCLSPEQIAQIRQSAAESFGPEARVWLFGSRVDDRKLGGDVGLLVESTAPIDNPAFLAAQLSSRLQRKMHGRGSKVVNIPQKLQEGLQFLARMTERESTACKTLRRLDLEEK